MDEVEYFNRTCQAPECDEVMGDLSRRAYCNDHLDEVLEGGRDPERDARIQRNGEEHPSDR